MNEEKASILDVDDFIPDGDEYNEYVGNMVMMQKRDDRLKYIVKNQT